MGWWFHSALLGQGGDKSIIHWRGSAVTTQRSPWHLPQWQPKWTRDVPVSSWDWHQLNTLGKPHPLAACENHEEGQVPTLGKGFDKAANSHWLCSGCSCNTRNLQGSKKMKMPSSFPNGFPHLLDIPDRNVRARQIQLVHLMVLHDEIGLTIWAQDFAQMKEHSHKIGNLI